MPTRVIEQRFGAQIRGEALSRLISSTFQEAVSTEKLRPAVQPSIATSGKPENGEIEYTATFEVMPGDQQRRCPARSGSTRQVSSVEEADIDQMIETLRLQRRSWNPVERAAQAGDMVLFEFAAQAADFRYPEAGTDRVGTIVGSNALFKELEDLLVGKKADDAFEADLDFPAGFRITGLAGKSAHATFKIVRVQGRCCPRSTTRSSPRSASARRHRPLPRGRAREPRARAGGGARGAPEGGHGRAG